MKKLALAVSILALPFLNAWGQSVDYKKIVLPDEAANVSFEERLVQLAWKNNPSSQIVQEEVVQAQEEFKGKRAEWTQLMGVTGNLNEFNVKALGESSSDEGNLFFPRYNFFVQVPLSLLFEKPHQKKAARSRVVASEHKVNLLKLELRARVLKLYSDYKKNEVIYLMKKQWSADEESNYKLIEQQFQNGNAPMEDYIRAQKSRNEIKLQLVLAENDLAKAKIDLEEVIGVRLEDVK